MEALVCILVPGENLAPSLHAFSCLGDTFCLINGVFACICLIEEVIACIVLAGEIWSDQSNEKQVRDIEGRMKIWP
jgi:hypothetical protein